MERLAVELETVPAAATAAPTTRPAKPAATVAKMTAAEFWSAASVAVNAIRRDYGERWKTIAPIGAMIICTVPSALRSYKGPRGGTIRWRPDQRLPAARYWPGGRLPEGLIIGEDHPRETSPLRTIEYAKWQAAWAAENGLTKWVAFG